MFPDYMTTAQDGGKVVSLTHRLPLPPGNAPGTHFCYRLVKGSSMRLVSYRESINIVINMLSNNSFQLVMHSEI